MINFIIIFTILLSGTIVASEIIKEQTNDVVAKMILSTTNKLNNNEGDTTPVDLEIKANHLKTMTTKDLNTIVIDPLDAQLRDIFMVNYIPNSESLNLSEESSTKESMESVEMKTFGHTQKLTVGPRLNIRPNCRCKLFNRCVQIELCERKNNS